MRMTPDLLETIEQSIELPLAETDAPLYLACQEIRAAWTENERLHAALADARKQIAGYEKAMNSNAVAARAERAEFERLRARLKAIEANGNA